MRKTLFLVSIILLHIIYSCSDDFIEPQLEQNDIIENTPITTEQQLETFLNGTYALMRSSYYYGRDYIIFGEVRGSDEMYSSGISGHYLAPSQFMMNVTDDYAANTWKSIYKVISNANIVINANITNYKEDSRVKELKAEAYAIRALAYFDLIKLYGQKYTKDRDLGVPLVLENPKEAAIFNIKRATLEECYRQIEADFDKAFAEAEIYNKKNRLGKTAIASLMSRYYLYKEDYNKVYQYSSLVTSDMNPIDLNLYVLSWRIEELNSIFELTYGTSGALGTLGLAYMFRMDGYANVLLTNDFVNLYEDNDIRIKKKLNSGDKTGMIRSNSAGRLTFLEGKTPILSGEMNQKLVRYEEIALNQIEAILQRGGGTLEEALGLINKIRKERGASLLTSITMKELKDERRRELVGEGFRVWDLLRWNKSLQITDASGALREQIPYGDYRLTFPIPQAEIDNNEAIRSQQNKGY